MNENIRAPENPNAVPELKIEGVNTAFGIAMMGRSVKNYLKVLAVFHEDGNDKIAEIKECCQKDLKLYTTYVHALKSSLAGIGAKGLSDAAKSLELAGRNEDMAFIENNNDKFLNGLETLLDNIKTAINGAMPEKHREGGRNLDSGSIKEKLSGIKEALNNMDVAAANEIMAELSREPVGDKMKDALSQIARCILLCEYNDAAGRISILIREGNFDL